ncbi:MAG: glycosyltransferase family 2 protein [Gemmataceae bacterium]
MADRSEGLSLVLPVQNRADRIDQLMGAWSQALSQTGRDHELIVVDDGSTDGTAEKIERAGGARLLRHNTTKGFGACIRTALAEARFPIFGYVGVDYPYTPADLRKLLEEYGKYNEELKMSVDCVSGRRTGIAVPLLWKYPLAFYRFFYRYALGNPVEPMLGWLGFGEHLYNHWTSWYFGNPFHDVNCAFKLFRKSRIETIPIQCDDDGIHTELVAKLTFLTTLMAEVPLTPKPDSIPSTVRKGMKKVHKAPLFRRVSVESPPAEVPPSPPADPVPATS